MYVLAIESSCDESSAAVVHDGTVLAMRTVTQSVHQQFGGVVPELAGRSHLQLVDRLTAVALAEASLSLDRIDLVASTVGPGLIGSLLVGSNYARGLSVGMTTPFRAVHHLEAHLWSAEIESNELPIPFIVLLVSGGHTLIVRVDGLRQYRIMGTTLDDALGEAYDKVGKLFGLGFPAGAAVDRLAQDGDAARFPLTPPKNDTSLDFSFSGLKTAVLYGLRTVAQTEVRNDADRLAAFQEAAMHSVAAKVRRAVEIVKPRAVVAAGGVAANSRLRQILKGIASEYAIACWIPPTRYCMDNAGMIAYLAWKLESNGVIDGDLPARPRWPLEELSRENSLA